MFLLLSRLRRTHIHPQFNSVPAPPPLLLIYSLFSRNVCAFIITATFETDLQVSLVTETRVFSSSALIPATSGWTGPPCSYPSTRCKARRLQTRRRRLRQPPHPSRRVLHAFHFIPFKSLSNPFRIPFKSLSNPFQIPFKCLSPFYRLIRSTHTQEV